MVDLRGGDCGRVPRRRRLRRQRRAAGRRSAARSAATAAGLGAGIAASGGATVKLHDQRRVEQRRGARASPSPRRRSSWSIRPSPTTRAPASPRRPRRSPWFSSTISGNTASGLHAAGSSSVTLRNVTLSGNGTARSAARRRSPDREPRDREPLLLDGGGQRGDRPAAASTSPARSRSRARSSAPTMRRLESRLLQRIGDHDDAGLQPDSPRRLRPGAGGHRSRRLRPEARRAGGLGWPDAHAPPAARKPRARRRRSRRLPARSISAPRAARATAISTPSSRADIGAHENGNTIFVNIASDLAAPDGNCSLRDAIRAANTDTAVDGCRAGFDRDLIWIDDAPLGDAVPRAYRRRRPGRGRRSRRAPGGRRRRAAGSPGHHRRRPGRARVRSPRSGAARASRISS